MKLETLKMLKNMESILDSIFVAIKSDVKDKLMNAFIIAQLSNLEVKQFSIKDNGLVIIDDKDGKETRFDLLFIPSIEDYNQITARLDTNEFSFDKTIRFEDDLTIIKEYTMDKYRFLNSNTEKRVYKDDELVYSVYQEKTNTDAIKNGYKHVVIENYLDGRTLKSKSTHIETLDGEVKLEEYKYKKKTLEKAISLDDRKEKEIYGTRRSIEGVKECPITEFDKFIAYWKELNENYKTTDYSYLKKDTSKGWL